jgi:hypothetical protein
MSEINCAREISPHPRIQPATPRLYAELAKSIVPIAQIVPQPVQTSENFQEVTLLQTS